MQYRVLHDGWVAGERAGAGDVLDLTPQQAKYEPVEVVEQDAKPVSRKAKAAPEVAL